VVPSAVSGEATAIGKSMTSHAMTDHPMTTHARVWRRSKATRVTAEAAAGVTTDTTSSAAVAKCQSASTHRRCRKRRRSSDRQNLVPHGTSSILFSPFGRVHDWKT
jgi:hypothetical protein